MIMERVARDGRMLVRTFASKSKQAKKSKGVSGDGNFEMMLRAIRGRTPDAEPFTDEEKARHAEVAKVFNRNTTIEHNHFMKDLQTKIDLKWDAINALPAELQEEALEQDFAPPPPGRFMATWTPPIPGFKRYVGQEDEDD